MLLARPGELVTREQLREGLWSNDTFVDFDRGLNTAVNRLRAALNDSAEKPRFVAGNCRAACSRSSTRFPAFSIHRNVRHPSRDAPQKPGMPF
jgi:hypothetical protein